MHIDWYRFNDLTNNFFEDSLKLSEENYEQKCNLAIGTQLESFNQVSSYNINIL